MHSNRSLSILLGLLFAASLLGGCGSTKEGGAEDDAATAVTITRKFSYDTELYHVEVRQQEREGQCIRRDVLFSSHSRLYTKPHIDRARAVDERCDATFISSFEDFAIMRDPIQQERFQGDFSFRRRVEEDLWDAYVRTILDDEWERRRARAE